MKAADLLPLVGRLAGQKVLVLGDVILDAYLEGIVRRISPEAPVPVLEQSTYTHRLGGAANVALSLAALGARPALAGVCGCDSRQPLLRDLLTARGIDHQFVIEDPSRPTALKTRVVAHAGQMSRSPQQLLRIDEESTAEVGPAVADALWARLGGSFADFSAVVISDYGKGLIHGGTWPVIEKLIKGHSLVSVVDPKKRNYHLYKNVDAMTHNHHEAGEDSGLPCETDDEVRAVGAALIAKHHLKHTLVTRGGRGMALCTREGEMTPIPTYARAVSDVSGAGDTVIAVWAAARAAGIPLYEAALLANHAAGVVVSKFGTATVSPKELEDDIRTHPLRQG